MKVLGIALAVTLLSLAAYCVMIPIWPKLEVQAKFEADGRLALKIQKNQRIRSLLTVGVWQEGADDYLWFLAVDRAEADRLVYGVVPANAQQRYPRGNQPPVPIKPGQSFCVTVAYQYDSILPPAPCLAEQTFCFNITDAGEIREVETPADVKLPKNYPGIPGLFDP